MNPESESDDDDLPLVYALRVTSRARADIETAYLRFIELQDEETAEEWRAGLLAAISSLARMPHRQIIVENKHFKQNIHQLLYRRTPGSIAYRILFVIIESKEDAPIVRILHVRHGSARPLTRNEARELEIEE